ncbi:ribosomal-protein-alanine acetyltransferase [Gracilibacillus boraciitolerans JCM 21714]|uniref:Ribosomal-protein-alanine acetyltransferase n=1 Tax=Gracilibacillus boraciitolerans JCM 21714 TaxID=1298598 RepID=W4VP10_9BACI|nr:GNAT family N-acetyltransferase [Gracilibacillus boraciitolerans]GAE95125.1 ribosomal-protein-alanine acetyltransferase [Gracilibacillus boraciitolerans JCM 21714]
MLKRRDVQDAPVLFDLMSHPEVFPFVRHKAYSSDEFYFLTKQTIEAEDNGELISRTIVDEQYNPIGTINLFDIENNAGFLATWIGQPYFGKGYNKLAKDAFFEELFYEQDIDAVFIKIRRANVRSLKAILKIPFVMYGNQSYSQVFEKINDSHEEIVYDLFVITKENYFSHAQTAVEEEEAI